MIVGTVIGRLWNDRELADLSGCRFVVVRGVDGTVTVAADLVEVAAGNLVLVSTDEGAHAALGRASAIDAAVVALVGGADALDALRSNNEAAA